jgi:hypothetical protein
VIFLNDNGAWFTHQFPDSIERSTWPGSLYRKLDALAFEITATFPTGRYNRKLKSRNGRLSPIAPESTCCEMLLQSHGQKRDGRATFTSTDDE